MKKDSVCSKCGAKKVGKFRTCNKEKDGERCGGAWKTTPKGHTQVQVESISNERKRDGLESFVGTAQLANLGVRYKDYDRCFDYGLCDFFHLCHYNDKSKYIFPKEKKDESTRKSEKS